MDYTSPDLAIWLEKDKTIDFLRREVERLELELRREKNNYANYRLRVRVSNGDYGLRSDAARKLVSKERAEFDGSMTVSDICKIISSKTGLGFHGVRSIWYRG